MPLKTLVTVFFHPMFWDKQNHPNQLKSRTANFLISPWVAAQQIETEYLNLWISPTVQLLERTQIEILIVWNTYSDPNILSAFEGDNFFANGGDPTLLDPSVHTLNNFIVFSFWRGPSFFGSKCNVYNFFSFWRGHEGRLDSRAQAVTHHRRCEQAQKWTGKDSKYFQKGKNFSCLSAKNIQVLSQLFFLRDYKL